jgi:signal transduction histidine kinase
VRVVRPVSAFPSIGGCQRPARAAVADDHALVRYVFEATLLTAAYYASAEVGDWLGFTGPVAALVWLPVGVSIAFLYLRGLDLWPAVLVGDLLVNSYSTLPLGTALGQTIGNVLEVLVATALLRRYARHGPLLGSVAGVARMFVAIAIGTALSATVGSLSAVLGGVISADAVPHVWRTWWLGDFSGALVVVPLALAWWRRPPFSLTPARRWEAVAVIAAVGGLNEVAFSNSMPVVYIVFPVLIWAAIRFGQRGATLAVLIAAGAAVLNTVRHDGPFVFESASYAVLTTQLFIVVAVITTLVIAAAVAEREAYARRLEASRARLGAASDTERRRIEQNLHDGAQQRLVALAIRLRHSAADAVCTPEGAAALIAAAEDELRQAVEELRELAHGIHPAALTTLGLGGAIRGVAARSTVRVELQELPALRLADTTEATAYFVVVEAITNAQKHARASKIRVRAVADAGALRLEIADDGVGGAAVRVGSGLEGLCDRVEAAGGTVRIDSPLTVGTRIAAVLPL